MKIALRAFAALAVVQAVANAPLTAQIGGAVRAVPLSG